MDIQKHKNQSNTILIILTILDRTEKIYSNQELRKSNIK
jgi:hypothetical protein